MFHCHFIHFYILLPLNFISNALFLTLLFMHGVRFSSFIHRIACVKFTLKTVYLDCAHSVHVCVCTHTFLLFFRLFVYLFVRSFCCSSSYHEKVSIDVVYLRDKSNLLIGFVTKYRLKKRNGKCSRKKNPKK